MKKDTHEILLINFLYKKDGEILTGWQKINITKKRPIWFKNIEPVLKRKLTGEAKFKGYEFLNICFVYAL